MGSHKSNEADNTAVVIALLFIWIILVLAFLYFYKKLNTDTNGQYTVQRIVFAPGGLRDRLRQGVGAVENRLGVHIWPQQRDDEETIGGPDKEDEGGEGQDKQNDSYTEEGEQQEHDDDRDDSSDDYSSVDLRERAKMQAEKKEEDKAEEDKEKLKEGEAAAAGKEETSEEVKNAEKVELLVDLKPFAGSAIWSEENKDGNDLTAL
ncbi:high mobility group nucleosome-binding domain-containing protein 5-like [Carassius auratus]|uniref:High mobility group nucleosome-binding domain-containing protein 5-like n=1 Tax=Carassius auratus TaxID=7957 RepID=A0A6P6PQ04_CARAU|nr:high mobility group nucleosome-binding domain-containing protein 5-like [Carassius auratus]